MFDPAKKVYRTSSDTLKHVKTPQLDKFEDLMQKKQARIPTIGVNSADMYLVWDWSEESRKHQIVVIRLEEKGKTLEAKVPVQALEHYLRMT